MKYLDLDEEWNLSLMVYGDMCDVIGEFESSLISRIHSSYMRSHIWRRVHNGNYWMTNYEDSLVDPHEQERDILEQQIKDGYVEIIEHT